RSERAANVPQNARRRAAVAALRPSAPLTSRGDLGSDVVAAWEQSPSDARARSGVGDVWRLPWRGQDADQASLRPMRDFHDCAFSITSNTLNGILFFDTR